MTPNGRVAREYFGRFSILLRGGQSDPFALCHPDLLVTVGGNLDLSGDIIGLDAYRTMVVGALSATRPSADNGIFVEQVFEEGERALVIARGLIDLANGRTYNNEYAVWMQFRERRIARLYEDCDTALVLTGPLGLTLLPRQTTTS